MSTQVLSLDEFTTALAESSPSTLMQKNVESSFFDFHKIDNETRATLRACADIQADLIGDGRAVAAQYPIYLVIGGRDIQHFHQAMQEWIRELIEDKQVVEDAPIGSMLLAMYQRFGIAPSVDTMAWAEELNGFTADYDKIMDEIARVAVSKMIGTITANAHG